MDINTNRHLSILYYFINVDRFATSEQLADFADSSVRTIKTDLVMLKESLSQSNICSIEVNRAKGYSLKINDPSQFDNFATTIMSEYSFFKNYDVEKMSRRIYLIQRILSSPNIKLEELADELYLTRSAIRHDMKWVTKFFNSYNVALNAKAGAGYYYEGGEYDIRFLMVETFCSQYHHLENILCVNAFNEMFYHDSHYYEDIRHAFLQLIRESKYSMKDISTKKLATYLVLSRQRIKAGQRVTISPEVIQAMEGKYELDLARQIFAISG